LGIARDISKLFSADTSLVTQTELTSALSNVSVDLSGYATASAVSATYLSQTSASTTYALISAGGLVLINSTSFSAQSGANINNVFSSTYESYRIIVEATAANNANVFFRFRSGTTDLSTGYYGGGLLYQTNGSLTSSGARNNGTEIMIQQSTHGGGPLGLSIFDVYGMTSATHQVVGFNQSPYSGEGRSFAYMTTNGGTRDGFVVFASTGTISGKVTTYGYRK
jgi:hypothetical protein